MGSSALRGIVAGLNKGLSELDDALDDSTNTYLKIADEKRKQKEKLQKEHEDIVSELKKQHAIVSQLTKLKRYSSGEDENFKKLSGGQRKSKIAVEKDVLAEKMLKRIGINVNKENKQNLLEFIKNGSIDQALIHAGIDPDEYNSKMQEYSPYLELERRSSGHPKNLDHYMGKVGGDSYASVKKANPVQQNEVAPQEEEYSSNPSRVDDSSFRFQARNQMDSPESSRYGRYGRYGLSKRNEPLKPLSPKEIGQHFSGLADTTMNVGKGALYGTSKMADGLLGFVEDAAELTDPTEKAYTYLGLRRAKSAVRNFKEEISDSSKDDKGKHPFSFKAGNFVANTLPYVLGGGATGVAKGLKGASVGKAALIAALQSGAHGMVDKRAEDEPVTEGLATNLAIGGALGGLTKWGQNAWKAHKLKKPIKEAFEKVAAEGSLGRAGVTDVKTPNPQQLERMFKYRATTLRNKPYGSPGELDYRLKAMGPHTTSGELLGDQLLINTVKKDTSSANIAKFNDMQLSGQEAAKNLVKDPDKIGIYSKINKLLEKNKTAGIKQYDEVTKDFATHGKSRLPKLKLSNDQIGDWSKIIDTHWDDFTSVPRMKAGWTKSDQLQFTKTFRNAVNSEKKLESLKFGDKSFAEIEKILEKEQVVVNEAKLANSANKDHNEQLAAIDNFNKYLKEKRANPKMSISEILEMNIEKQANVKSSIGAQERALIKKQKIVSDAKESMKKYEKFLKVKGSPDPSGLLDVQRRVHKLQTSASSGEAKFYAGQYYDGLQKIIEKAGKGNALAEASKNYSVNVGPFNQDTVEKAVKASKRVEGREGSISISKVFGKDSTENALLYQKLSVQEKKDVIYAIIRETVSDNRGEALKHMPKAYKALPEYIRKDKTPAVQALVKELDYSANVARAASSSKRSTTSDIGTRNVFEDSALSGTESGSRLFKQAARRALKIYRHKRFRKDTSRDFVDFYNAGSPGEEVPELKSLWGEVSKHPKMRVPPFYTPDFQDGDTQNSYDDYIPLKRRSH